MARFTLEQLANDVAAKPQMIGRLFSYHASNGKYGPAAAAAIAVPDRARNYAQNTAVATARTAFETQRGNPTANDVLLRTYLPVYNREMNREGRNRGKNIAIGMGAAGIALFVWSLIADAEVAKKTGKVAAGIFEAGAAIRLIRDYFRYKA